MAVDLFAARSCIGPSVLGALPDPYKALQWHGAEVAALPEDGTSRKLRSLSRAGLPLRRPRLWYIDERAETRRIADAATVRMSIVERAAVFDVVVQEDLVRIYQWQLCVTALLETKTAMTTARQRGSS